MYKNVLMMALLLSAGSAGAQPGEEDMAGKAAAAACDLEKISLGVTKEPAIQKLNIKTLTPVSKSDLEITEYLAKSEDGIITLKLFEKGSSLLFGVINAPASNKSGMRPYILSRAYMLRALSNLDPAAGWPKKGELLGQALREVTSVAGGMKSLVSGNNSISFLHDESADQLTVSVFPNELLENCDLEKIMAGMDVN